MNTSKGTLYVREPDGTCIVLADGVDISYACEFQPGGTVRLPRNLPAGCTVSLPSGWRIANALHRETSRQRKAREAAESAQRAAVRAASASGAVMVEDDEEVSDYAKSYAINLMTYGVWWALYGRDTVPPFPISAGHMPQEETCSSY